MLLKFCLMWLAAGIVARGLLALMGLAHVEKDTKGEAALLLLWPAPLAVGVLILLVMLPDLLHSFQWKMGKLGRKIGVRVFAVERYDD